MSEEAMERARSARGTTLAEREPAKERLDVVVIGAGQAGLSVGYYLTQMGVRFAILDGADRIGDVWRKRWDSLRLFTPARFDGLVGMPFPAPPDSFPTKGEMADYLEAYATRFELPVRTRARVKELTREGSSYIVRGDDFEIEAAHVVVAMATYQRPKVPALAVDLEPSIVQLHSSEYKNPSQLRPGGVLIVGAGNSGAEIAVDLARAGHPIAMSGKSTGEVPFRIDGFWARLFLLRLVLRVFFHRVLTVNTPMGRKMRPTVLAKGGPLIRTKLKDLLALGVERVPRVVGAENGRPVLEDGRALDVANVVWCSGFHPGFSWINLPILDEHGEPHHDSGLARGEPGLYFVGLHFLHAFSSTMIHGVARDAARIARVIAARSRATIVQAQQPRALERATA